ncbi:uncharacterized protein LOC131932293, partial [Physella acuta]|uniref:uncharacterized protein LOC131932293 n=1 Tax=Physella acuta TaxID=109671 RepID=UPI0027DC985C
MEKEHNAKGIKKIPSNRRHHKRSQKSGIRPKRQKLSFSSKAGQWLEPRILLIATGFTILGLCLQIIAISTDSWLIIDGPDNSLRNVSGPVLIKAYSGLWRLCKTEMHKGKNDLGSKNAQHIDTVCVRHKFFSSKDSESENREFESNHL